MASYAWPPQARLEQLQGRTETRSPMASLSRRPHRKSRTGCERCKKRKVKCDELKPACTNCLKHSVPCNILATSPSASASPGALAPTENGSSPMPKVAEPSLDSSCNMPVVEDWQQAAALNILDLELLHNFCTSTCYTLHSDPTLKTLWAINVPRLGFKYDFVMHGILSLSALHLAYTRPERREWYISQATLQNQASLGLVTSILPNITDENCSAIYLFSTLTFILKLASPHKPGDLLVIGESGLQEWLTLFRGMQAIIQSSHDALESGVLGPMFAVGARRSRLRDVYASEQSVEVMQLGNLRHAIQCHVIQPHLLHVYMDAIDELQKSYALAYKGAFEVFETAEVFVFLFRVSEEYFRLLEDRTQESLAIFAYFCPIAKRLEGNWWSKGLSNHLMSEIYPLLDEEHRLWIQWAMEEIGWLPTRKTGY